MSNLTNKVTLGLSVFVDGVQLVEKTGFRFVLKFEFVSSGRRRADGDEGLARGLDGRSTADKVQL